MNEPAARPTDEPQAEDERSPMEKAVALLGRQHGAVSDSQLRTAGVTWKVQQRMLRSDLWTTYAKGVVLDAASPSTWQQRAMAATLLPGAKPLLCSQSAARLHDLEGFDSDDVEVLIPLSNRLPQVDNVVVRRTRHLSKKDRHVIDSIPVTILPVTLIHLAAFGFNAEKALDSALRDGHSPRWMREVFTDRHKAGMRCSGTLLELLEVRVDRRLPRSWFQRVAKRIFDQAGIELAEEVPVYERNGRLLAELDLANEQLKVGVECQSWQHHGSPEAVRRDLTRKRRLRQLGWEIVEVWWSDLKRTDEVVADVRLALARAAALNGSTA
jgi:REase_MTES_1575